MNRREAMAIRAKIEHAAAQQTDKDALGSVELFPRWQAGRQVESGYRCQHEGTLYKCVQSHTTQAGWEPDITPALWTEVSVEEWPEWRRPQGSHDAYNIGDKVTYNSEHYISTINGNIYSPEEFPAGWDKQKWPWINQLM